MKIQKLNNSKTIKIRKLFPVQVLELIKVGVYEDGSDNIYTIMYNHKNNLFIISNIGLTLFKRTKTEVKQYFKDLIL